jgi:hypothetical protein
MTGVLEKAIFRSVTNKFSISGILLPQIEPVQDKSNYSSLTMFLNLLLLLCYCDFIFLLLVSIFVNRQKLKCSLTLELMVLILANDFSCYLCLRLCTKFRGLIEPTKNHGTWYLTNKNEFKGPIFMVIF